MKTLQVNELLKSVDCKDQQEQEGEQCHEVSNEPLMQCDTTKCTPEETCVPVYR